MGDFVNKRGQVTIFIIVALLVIAIAALVYILSPGIGFDIGRDSNNPYDFMKTCLEEDLENNIEIISLQGGSLEPEAYYLYNDYDIEYLCYTNEYYEPCVMQQPLLKNHIESEIKSSIENVAAQCFSSMDESFQKKGYSTNLVAGSLDVNITLDKVLVDFIGYEFMITKGETERYDNFKVELLNNNLYELIMIASNILEWEVAAGYVDVTFYMDYYPKIKVEQDILGDGTTIYKLEYRDSENKFQFASRSLVWPAGYPQF